MFSPQITHEFPLKLTTVKSCGSWTPYDYALVHHILQDPEYAEYFKNALASGREVYLDNSLHELGEAFDKTEYQKAIEDLHPTHYILPDVFDNYQDNLDSNKEFLGKFPVDSSITPIAAIHATTPDDLWKAFVITNNFLPENGMIAFPYSSAAFDTPREEVKKLFEGSQDTFKKSAVNPGYIYRKYKPFRQAANRWYFTLEHFDDIKKSDRKIHLLGCKCLFELKLFLNTLLDFDFIRSLDTSLPVAMAFEGYNLQKFDSEFKPVEIPDNKEISRVPSDMYKPTLTIESIFYKEIIPGDLMNKVQINIRYMNSWKNPVEAEPAEELPPN